MFKMSALDPPSSPPLPIFPSSPERGVKKKFACTWQGCGKSFSRSEHLHRHALNHKDGNNTCLRCAAHFRRRDLLDRHMLRHREKDLQAGGEGLGLLATRKRLWRDTDGNIVNARRPRSSQGTKKRQLSSAEEISGASPPEQDYSFTSQAPAIQPATQSLQGVGFTNNGQFGVSDFMHDAWVEMERSAPLSTEVGDASDFLCNANWGDQPCPTVMGLPSDLPHNDIFTPDTAMSFNQTFTTLSYYSWLFEDDAANQTQTSLPHPIPRASGTTMTGPTSAVPAHISCQSINDIQMQTYPSQNSNTSDVCDTSQTLDSNYQAFPMLSSVPLEPGHQIPLKPGGNNIVRPRIRQNASQVDVPVADMIQSNAAAVYGNSSTSSGDQSELSPATFNLSTSQSAYSNSQGQLSPSKSYTSQPSPPNQSPEYLNSQLLPDACTRQGNVKLPLITSKARDGLIRVVVEAHPTRPDGSEINSSDALLSLDVLQHYSDLFFTLFNSSYPLIHQSTFDSGKVHPFLLMSILLLGATYSDKEAHMLAVCLHDIMRPVIHSSKEFSNRPELWMLQTILLVECFGKSRAGEKQHDMSHLYHGLLINLIRRTDCQIASVAPFSKETQSIEEYWRLAVEAEQKRRLAMLCFMWDTQHAVLFSQSLCMNASELKLTLPWDNSIWEASSAEEWHTLLHNAPPPPQYLYILKMYTNPSATPVPFHLNALSRVLILHGLMSISWDLNRRDQTSLSLSITNSSLPWQRRMSSCYANWKVDYDMYSNAVLNLLSSSPAYRSSFQRFYVASKAIYHTAQLILNIDINDLQIHAGAGHIIGRPVTDIDRLRSRSNIANWISRGDGEEVATATWHAARILRDGVRKLENWNVDEMFHYPWCLCLATLMCWLFHDAAVKGSVLNSALDVTQKTGHSIAAFQPEPFSRDGTRPSKSVQSDDFDDEDSDWDSRVEMIALISALTKLSPTKEEFIKDMWGVSRKHRTYGLLKCMVSHLKTVRWAVVRQGMNTLQGLLQPR